MSRSNRSGLLAKEIRELESRIALCEEYKARLSESLVNLNNRKKDGLMSTQEYLSALDNNFEGKNPIDWIYYYDNEIKKARERIRSIAAEIPQGSDDSKTAKGKNLKILAATLIVIFMFGLGAFVYNSRITGFAVNLGGKEILANYTDGYGIEGSKWAEIKGERMYERCMRISSGIGFDAVSVNAKITSATDRDSLVLALYNQSRIDEPDAEIGSCAVNDYSGMWKSCLMDNLNGAGGSYWICAYSANDDWNSTYYTIAYSTGGSRKTALWAGSYWQKLEGASYTMNADFIRWK